MRMRLIVFGTFLLALAGIALWWRSSSMGGGGFYGVWFILLPILVGIGPTILLPRKPAIAWSLLIVAGAAVLTAMSLTSAESCNGDGCIGYFFFSYFVGLPVVVVGTIIAAIRYFAKPAPAAGATPS